ncbi:MAG: DinB family protein [Bacteroidota bacterium]
MPSYILGLVARIEAVSAEVEKEFSALDGLSLNWKVSPKSWSIAQCLDHLITTNKLYFPILTAAQNAQPPQNIFSRLKLFSGFFGRTLRKQLGAEVISKSKSPKNFRPTASDLSTDIVSNFLRHQETLIAQFEALPERDFKNMMMISPAAAFVTYSLEDALYILTGHEERHLGQAKRVMQMPGFPTNLQ